MLLVFFWGGTVYAKWDQASGGTLSSSKIISGTYSAGTNQTKITPAVGGINSLYRQGYTISNPSNGIFDIKFNTAYTEIYRISVNIVDAYGNTTSFTTGRIPIQINLEVV